MFKNYLSQLNSYLIFQLFYSDAPSRYISHLNVLSEMENRARDRRLAMEDQHRITVGKLSIYGLVLSSINIFHYLSQQFVIYDIFTFFTGLSWR